MMSINSTDNSKEADLSPEKAVSRRNFLKLATVGAASVFLSPLSSLGGISNRPVALTPKAESVYQRLHGPLASVTIPFTVNYKVDYGALRSWVDFICEDKPPILFFTFGDGEIDMLSEEEIAKINLIVAEQVGGRALFVGATGPWWTGRMSNFVKRMEDGGLDAINLHFSPRIQGIDQLYTAFEQIANETEIPLLIYDGSRLPASSIRKLSTIPQVVGVKSHANVYSFYDQARMTRDSNFAVLGAGQMKQFLYGAQVGSPGYLCPLAPLAPQVSWRFYDAVQSGKWDKAKQIVFEYEEPLLKTTIPIGYPQAYKAMLYLAGHYPTNLVRLPRITPPVEKLKYLKSFLQEKGIIETR